MNSVESNRLRAQKQDGTPWKKWGPYLSERQWGTVREDYSQSGNAWESFPHDQARSRAYRWGEDGLAGFSDDKQSLCFSLAFWNEHDPIIKERLFGLTNGEGNHGEDVKEYYYYLDSTPTHSYMRYLYKYPQQAFPYDDLVKGNRRRGRNDLEYELIDTGIFDEDRYFDCFVEYAKESPEDVLVKITIHNRGAESAPLHVLPTMWFRNTWTFASDAPHPRLRATESSSGVKVVQASHVELGRYYLYAEGDPSLLFTENETNQVRLVSTPNSTPFVKDGINDYIVSGRTESVNPDLEGTKVSPHYSIEIAAGSSRVIRLRLTNRTVDTFVKSNPFGVEFEESFKSRQNEADEFYQEIIPTSLSEDETLIARQGLAGMLWTKQYYKFDGVQWLKERGFNPLKMGGKQVRNKDWYHMRNDHIISMPDKWEYPWYAAWDLAFHAVALAIVDVDFAKQQLLLMVDNVYQHPNGQIPAYEWNFSDVNPPVHAWGALNVYRTEKEQSGKGDLEFLKNVFGKLTNNFTWWVNRKDQAGNNIFEGGFLGLDNISVFDRSAQLPTGGHLEQADGTAWMALFCQNMIEIATELATEDPTYQEHVVKFCEHFVWIACAINQQGDLGLWDEEDGFYYDVMRLPDGTSTRLKVRSMVGLLPLCATTVIEPSQREHIPHALNSVFARFQQLPELMDSMHVTGPHHRGVGDRGIISLLPREKLERILNKLLDENEFLSEYGIRSLSRYHLEHPFSLNVAGSSHSVGYLPAESDSGLFGGNSNWRGPIWLAVNALIIRALIGYYLYYGDNLKVECPTGSGNHMNLFEVSREISKRLSSIFTRNEAGHRPVFGAAKKFQDDPHWRDYILFYEYFHGDNGAGLGASHQTGWTGLVVKFLQIYKDLDGKALLQSGRSEIFRTAQTASRT